MGVILARKTRCHAVKAAMLMALARCKPGRVMCASRQKDSVKFAWSLQVGRTLQPTRNPQHDRTLSLAT